MVVEPGLCGTWSETPKRGFLTMRLISYRINASTFCVHPSVVHSLSCEVDFSFSRPPASSVVLFPGPAWATVGLLGTGVVAPGVPDSP